MAISLKDLKKKAAQKKKEASAPELPKKKSLRPWEGNEDEGSVVRTHTAKLAVEKAQKRLQLLAADNDARTVSSPVQLAPQTQAAQRRIEELEKIVSGKVDDSSEIPLLRDRQAGIFSFIKFILRC